MGYDFSTIEARVTLARKYATKYLLDTALVCAIADHESGGWIPWATRYEPLFFDKYVQPLVNTGVVHTMSEANARATSWGLMQIMGQTARELGFTGKYLSELCDPDVGLDLGCKKFGNCLTESGGDSTKAMLRYNGGGDASYPDLVKDLMPKYY